MIILSAYTATSTGMNRGSRYSERITLAILLSEKRRYSASR